MLFMLVWVPAAIMAVLFVMAGEPLGWLAVAAVIALVGFSFAWEIVVWLRQVPPVVVDASGIDLQGSGQVPWREVRAVVFDSHRLWLELNRDTAAFVARRTFPPWFTAAHENLLGDAAWIAPGNIHVALRWADVRPVAAVPVAASAAPSAKQPHLQVGCHSDDYRA